MDALHLAIECSGLGGSIALLRGSELVDQRSLPEELSSVQCLASCIRESLSTATARPDFLSVTAGPGSFTSLRVGLATAKMLGYAWGVPIAGVDSLHAIAMRAFREPASDATAEKLIIPVMNAFRKQVFSAVYLTQPGGLKTLTEALVVDAPAWLADPLGTMTGNRKSDESLKSSLLVGAVEIGRYVSNKQLVTGPGLKTYPIVESAQLESDQLVLAPESLWQPAAVDVGRIGWELFLSGKAVTSSDLQPNYVRQSAAEEAMR